MLGGLDDSSTIATLIRLKSHFNLQFGMLIPVHTSSFFVTSCVSNLETRIAGDIALDNVSCDSSALPNLHNASCDSSTLPDKVLIPVEIDRNGS